MNVAMTRLPEPEMRDEAEAMAELIREVERLNRAMNQNAAMLRALRGL